MTAAEGPLLAVDAPSLMYRAFFGLPSSIRGAEGGPVNALLGMSNLVLAAVAAHAPRATVLCWGAEAAMYRVALFAGYHADRPPMPDELVPQWDDAPALFAEFGWPSLNGGDLEADDVLGSLALIESAAGGSSLLFTGDRDMFQCADDQTTVLFPATGGPELIDADGVRQRYGIEPAQVPDLIALRGDPSDGLPGAKGIGAKGAAELLGRFGDLEGAITAAASATSQMTPRQRLALTTNADLLRDFRSIATLQPLPVERPGSMQLNRAGASAATAARGMGRLSARLAAGGA